MNPRTGAPRDWLEGPRDQVVKARRSRRRKAYRSTNHRNWRT
jgi:hypothetical protein